MNHMDLFTDKGKYAGIYEIDFGIKPGDLILDVGGGNKPYPKSTHVVDISGNDEQRYRRPLNIGNREFIDGDAGVVLEKFADNYFDFCFSSHTFEHIKNLSRALDLISKKCKRGFYAIPASDMEFFSTHKFFGHVNLCRQIGDTLHFAKRPENTVLEDISNIFDKGFFEHPKIYPLLQGHGGKRGYRFLWEARYYWEGKIKYKYYENPEDLYPQVKYFK